MRTLITGVTGFVGGHLADDLLHAGGHTLFGLSRTAAWPAATAHLAGRVELVPAALADRAAVAAALAHIRPDRIFHLAGYANTGRSFKEPDACWADNLDGTRAFYAAVHASGLKPRIVFASTGLIYGDAAGDRACDERSEFHPASPYAASKAAADILSYQVTKSPGLDVVRVRLFNQFGPRQPADYAVGNFGRQVAAIEAGHQPPILETGDLSSWRDVTDVRDMVAAIRLVGETGRTGEAYNAGTGSAVQIRALLDGLVKLCRVPVEVRSKVEPGRAADTAVTRADATKLRTETGWAPRYSVDQTLADVLAFWRGAAVTRPGSA